MKWKDTYLLVICAILVIVVSSFTLVPSAHATQGPRTENLLIRFYSSDLTAYSGLLAKEFDIYIWPLTAEQYYEVIGNPELLVGEVLENGMFEFDINGNLSIPDRPWDTYGASPTSYFGFRQALARLTDKQYIVDVICEGFAHRMDVPIVANAPAGWFNESVVYPNYPWEYDPVNASALLDRWGFVQGTTDNPDYDPTVPWSSPKIRVYPDYAIVHDSPKVGIEVTGPPYVWTLRFDGVEDPGYLEWTVMGVLEGEKYYKELDFTFDDGANTVTVDGVTLEEGTFLWIEYLTPHPKAGQDLDPIKFCIRSDHSLRMEAGLLLSANLKKIGVPVDEVLGTSKMLFPIVMGELNYHIYTGGWGLGVIPLFFYYGYHPSWYFPYSYNYVNPPCEYPDDMFDGVSTINPNYDLYLEGIYYANSPAEAMKNARNAEWYHVMRVVNIPLWCSKSYYAWWNYVLGVCNMKAYGPNNFFTWLNAYKDPSAPEPNTLRLGANQPPLALNILFSEWVYDYNVLDPIFASGFLASNPYIIDYFMPWVGQDYEVGTWVDPADNETKTYVKWYLRKDVHFVKSPEGTYAGDFNVTDYIFSLMFTYGQPDAWSWDETMDIHHVEVVDDYTVIVYFDYQSYWYFLYADPYFINPDYWIPQFCTEATVTATGTWNNGTIFIWNATSAGVIEVTLDGIPLTENEDYWVLFGESYAPPYYNETMPTASQLYFLKDLGSGTLTVRFWNVTGDPTGFYPGSDTDWEPTTQGIGMYYLIDVIPEAGGYATLKRNPYYFLETPPLGEVDFWWYQGTPEDPNARDARGALLGYFIVDIMDVAYGTVAYGSRGIYEPDPYWTPGADLAPSYTVEVPLGGEIDIYDIATILISYGTVWGETPADP